MTPPPPPPPSHGGDGEEAADHARDTAQNEDPTAGTDAGGEDVDETPPSGFDAWRRRSAAGGVGTAIARGLGAIFAPAENRQVVSAPVPGDPPDPEQGFRVVLDPDDPAKSVALFASPAEADDPADSEPSPGGPDA